MSCIPGEADVTFVVPNTFTIPKWVSRFSSITSVCVCMCVLVYIFFLSFQFLLNNRRLRQRFRLVCCRFRYVCDFTSDRKNGIKPDYRRLTQNTMPQILCCFPHKSGFTKRNTLVSSLSCANLWTILEQLRWVDQWLPPQRLAVFSLYHRAGDQTFWRRALVKWIQMSPNSQHCPQFCPPVTYGATHANHNKNYYFEAVWLLSYRVKSVRKALSWN